VWPLKGPTPINLNTAPEQVLRSLGNPKETEPLSDSEVEFLLEGRTNPKYFGDTGVVAQGSLAGKHIDPAAVSVASSNYFILHTTTEFQGHRYSLESLLHRIGDKKPERVEIEARTYGEW
jgi:type II secretory pathway component PulK